MRLAISNIAWESSDDTRVYEIMRKYHFTGLEIAPTRIFPEMPYEKRVEARQWSRHLKDTYGLIVPSMQSIWFGRQEKVFGSEEERNILLDYTEKAIDFAAAIDCKNLVFGCPKNRNLPDGTDPEIAVVFFKKMGDYAYEHGTVVSMEANPPIYNTNYINNTESALELVREVDSKGFLLNLDIGTMIQNEECMTELIGKTQYINHVHISEPHLRKIEERTLHNELSRLLDKENYSGFVSIEMGKGCAVDEIEKIMQYVHNIFAGSNHV